MFREIIKEILILTRLKLVSNNLDAFHWIMHLADGSNSNFDISEQLHRIDIINEALDAMHHKDLLEFI